MLDGGAGFSGACGTFSKGFCGCGGFCCGGFCCGCCEGGGWWEECGAGFCPVVLCSIRCPAPGSSSAANARDAVSKLTTQTLQMKQVGNTGTRRHRSLC